MNAHHTPSRSNTSLFFVLSLLLAAASAFMVIGCASTPNIPESERRQLVLAIEEGDPNELGVTQYNQRVQLRDYMRADLVKRLDEAGFNVVEVASSAEYAQYPGAQLLVVHYDNYDPGSAAARVMVGFGAGSCSLDLSAYLYDGERLLDSWRDGRASSMAWGKVVKKLDQEMVKRVRAVLQALNP